MKAVRNILVVACIVVGISTAQSQDLIVTTAGDSLRCLITEINSTQLHFKHRVDKVVTLTIMPLELVKHYEKNFFNQYDLLEEAARPENATPSKPDEVPVLREDAKRRLTAYLMLGIGYRIGTMPDGLRDEARSHINGLRPGLALTAGAAYYVSKRIGIGVKANMHYASQTTDNITLYDLISNTSMTGTLSEDIRITFVGPVVQFRSVDRYENAFKIASVGLGYLHYKDDFLFDDIMQKRIGQTLGLTGEFSYDITVGPAKRNSLVVSIGVILGVLTKYVITEGSVSQTVNLPPELYENLGRIDASVGFRFSN